MISARYPLDMGHIVWFGFQTGTEWRPREWLVVFKQSKKATSRISSFIRHCGPVYVNARLTREYRETQVIKPTIHSVKQQRLRQFQFRLLTAAKTSLKRLQFRNLFGSLIVFSKLSAVFFFIHASASRNPRHCLLAMIDFNAKPEGRSKVGELDERR